MAESRFVSQWRGFREIVRVLIRLPPWEFRFALFQTALQGYILGLIKLKLHLLPGQAIISVQLFVDRLT